MKRIIFSLLLLLCAGNIFGQNADELMKRWKARRGMSYQNISKKLKRDRKENPDVATWIISKGQIVRGLVSEIGCQQLQKDLDALEGFKCIYHEKHNSNDEGPVSDDFKLFHNIQYYAIEDGEYITDLVARIDADTNDGNDITLIRLQGKIKQEDVSKIIGIKETKTTTTN